LRNTSSALTGIIPQSFSQFSAISVTEVFELILEYLIWLLCNNVTTTAKRHKPSAKYDDTQPALNQLSAMPKTAARCVPLITSRSTRYNGTLCS
jgi:hypothetical protein